MSLRDSTVSFLREGAVLRQIPTQAILQRQVKTERVTSLPTTNLAEGDQRFWAVGGDLILARRTSSAWEYVGQSPVVTSLPTGVPDGFQVIYTADDTNGVEWQLRYDAGTAAWRFIGGAPLHAEVTTEQTTASTSYAALTTAGPSIAVPLAGTYVIETGCRGHVDTNAGFCGMSYDIGGTAASDNDWVVANEPAGSNTSPKTQMRRRRKTFTAVTLTAKYRTSAGTAAFSNRWMSLTPVTVS